MKQFYDPSLALKIVCLIFIGLAFRPNLMKAQCALDVKISVGECRYNEATNKSEVLVAVSADWSNEPAGALIQISFKGVTKTIDPANASCPSYVQFIVPLTLPMPTPEMLTARFTSGNCTILTRTVTLPAACPAPSCNGISGHVYHDFDADGVRDASEFGISGVTVKVFDCNNNELCSTVSSQNGIWGCGYIDALTLVRVEFSNFPTGYFSGELGKNNKGGTVQFVTVKDCDVDFGLVNPTDFCDPSALIVTPCYVTGLPVSGTKPGNADVLVAAEYSSPDYSADVNKYLANASEIGSVWGVAYDKKTKRLFTSALLKRHSGLGPAGLGGIYLTNMSALPTLPPAAGNTSLFINLEAVKN